MMALIGPLLFMTGIVFYAIVRVIEFRDGAHALVFGSNHPTAFWGKDSDKRKYKLDVAMEPIRVTLEALGSERKGWFERLKYRIRVKYYDFYKLKYLEAFPGSCSILVFNTDGYHFSQLAFKVFALAGVLLSPNNLTWFQWFVIYALLGSLTFELFFTHVLPRKTKPR